MRVVYLVDTKPDKPLFASKSLANDFVGFSYGETNIMKIQVNNHITNFPLYDSINEALLDYGIPKLGKPLLKRFVVKMNKNFQIDSYKTILFDDPEAKTLVGIPSTVNKYTKDHSKPKLLAVVDRYGIHKYPQYYLAFTINITKYMRRYQNNNHGKLFQQRLKGALKMAKTILQPKLREFILSWDVDPIFVRYNTPESVFDTFGFAKMPSENKREDIYQYVFNDMDDILWG